MRSTNALHHADLLLRPSQLGWKLGKNFCSIMPEQRSSCGGFVGCHDALCLTEVVEHKRATSSLLLYYRTSEAESWDFRKRSCRRTSHTIRHSQQRVECRSACASRRDGCQMP